MCSLDGACGIRGDRRHTVIDPTKPLTTYRFQKYDIGNQSIPIIHDDIDNRLFVVDPPVFHIPQAAYGLQAVLDCFGMRITHRTFHHHQLLHYPNRRLIYPA